VLSARGLQRLDCHCLVANVNARTIDQSGSVSSSHLGFLPDLNRGSAVDGCSASRVRVSGYPRACKCSGSSRLPPVRKRLPWMRPEDYEHMLDGLHKAGWQG